LLRRGRCASDLVRLALRAHAIIRTGGGEVKNGMLISCAETSLIQEFSRTKSSNHARRSCDGRMDGGGTSLVGLKIAIVRTRVVQYYIAIGISLRNVW
jgi:hypothetical protein